MPGVQQKFKLMKLWELLKRETDEDHPISRRELCRRLNEMGISSNVRTLSLDIEELTVGGYEIISRKQGKEKVYFVADHEFSIPELKIIIDALQAASFVTEKKTAELVEKIAMIGGLHKAELLKSSMVRFNTRKHTNEAILYTVDSIEDAIARRKKITFNYFHLNEKAERVYVTTRAGRKKRYSIEPVALILNEDNYYLMATAAGTPARRRTIASTAWITLSSSRTRSSRKRRLPGSTASPHSPRKRSRCSAASARLSCSASISSSSAPSSISSERIPPMKSVDENTCEATVHVQIAPTFFGWLAQFGDKMKVLEPESVVEKYREHIGQIQ